jgi:murein DD-endopeptidase MepM/ murein hydrolase activator NlpD
MRRTLTHLLCTALLGAALGVLATPAWAEMRALVVRAPDGALLDVQVDLPAGSPTPETVPVPGYAEPLRVEEDRGPVSPPTPAPERPAPRDAEPVERARPRRPRSGRDHSKSTPRRRRAEKRARRSERPTAARRAASPTAAPAAELTSVPNFVIRRFEVPIFLLPIYQAAGIEYGVRWEVLAAINDVETDYGRNLRVSSAGAVGWMQFMPSTWQLYGVDGNRDGRRDPYNPVDAIFSAARYLKAAGAQRDLRAAIFAYNHADWYVEDVLARAGSIAGIPTDLVGSLTGLTEGRFPVYARARYEGARVASASRERVAAGENAARVVEDDEARDGMAIYSRTGAPVVAVSDGVIKRVGRSRRLGRYVVLQDAYGNRYTYGGLGKVSRYHPVPREDAGDERLEARVVAARRPERSERTASPRRRARARPRAAVAVKRRLFAHPRRPAARRAGGLEQIVSSRARVRGHVLYRSRSAPPLELDSRRFRLRRMRPGSRVVGGTLLGRVGEATPGVEPHLYFEVRPAGRDAPRIDPRPILDGWQLLERTAVYRASGRSALHGEEASIGQVLLLPKPLLERRVLADPRIQLYPCGRRDVATGQVDRRVLAVLAYLAESGLEPTVTSLKCGHGFYTASGNVSHHSSGNAVDISAIDGVPILGHQGPGDVTERTVRRLMALQGTLRADQLISMLDLGANTLAMADHADHIHVGFAPLFGSGPSLGREAREVLEPEQWHDLVDRLGQIDNPRVPARPSRFALPVH